MDDWWNKNRRFFSFSTLKIRWHQWVICHDWTINLLYCDVTLPFPARFSQASLFRFGQSACGPSVWCSKSPVRVSARRPRLLQRPGWWGSVSLMPAHYWPRAPGCPRPRARPLSSGHCSQGQRATDAWPPLCIPAASTPWRGTVRLEAGPPLERLG